MKDKNIGVNSLRSSYASYWLPKCTANQVQRIAYLMRTSPAMLFKNYLKKSKEESEEETPKQHHKQQHQRLLLNYNLKK